MTNNNLENSNDWAKKAYAQLKQKQEQQKIEQQKIEQQKQEQQKIEQQKIEQQKIEQQKIEQQKVERLEIIKDQDFIDDVKPKLGKFDEEFTWSAMVLAAQGKKVEQISLDEIDWLSRLRKGLEETRKGFVTELLDKLGDDPLTPETLDDLETLLLRADAGINSTDKVMSSLRKKLNEEVVGGEQGIKFLKEELISILEVPIKKSNKKILVPEKDKLNIWLIVGVNGVGKTTTIGKLAHLSTSSKYKTLIAAADTFRAAAVEQLMAVSYTHLTLPTT